MNEHQLTKELNALIVEAVALGELKIAGNYGNCVRSAKIGGEIVATLLPYEWSMWQLSPYGRPSPEAAAALDSALQPILDARKRAAEAADMAILQRMRAHLAEVRMARIYRSHPPFVVTSNTRRVPPVAGKCEDSLLARCSAFLAWIAGLLLIAAVLAVTLLGGD